MRTCTIGNCEGKHSSRGFCRHHYYLWWRYGDPLAPDRKVPIRDPEDAFVRFTRRDGDCIVWTGLMSDRGYGRVRDGNRIVPAHRYAWWRVNGPIPDGMMIDHKCWNPACVNVEHLRLATRAENGRYRSKSKIPTATGVRNVSMNGRNFKVTVHKDGRDFYFGTFGSIDEAARVAERARSELFGEFAGEG